VNDGSAAFFTPVRPDDPRGFPSVPGLEPLRLLGRGASATVWLARERAPIAREVAVKVLDAGRGGGEELERFRREWSAVARAAGEGVANILSAGIAPDGRAYLVMERVDGEPLVEACERRSLRMSERLELVAQLCDIIERIHCAGIVHRDLKPSNIMVSFALTPPRLTVLDFGVARVSNADRALTEAGVPLGTPEWMAPEQTGLAPFATGPETDLWAIGLIIERLWTGNAPFDRGDGSRDAVGALLARVARAERRVSLPPEPRPSWDDLPSEAREDLATLLHRLGAVDPAAREASAARLGALIRAIASTPRGRPPRMRISSGGRIAVTAVCMSGVVLAWIATGESRTSPSDPVPTAGLRVDAWGFDEDGRCAIPVDGRYIAIAAGATYSLAVRADGSIVAAGLNSDGATDVPQSLTARPKIAAVEVAARDEGAAALLVDGTVIGWGRRRSFEPNRSGVVRSIAARRTALMAIMDDGTIAIDGPAPGGMVSVPGGSGFVLARVGHKTAAAMDASGALVAWGSDATGIVTNALGLRVRDFDFTGRDSALSSLGVVHENGSVAVFGAQIKEPVPTVSAKRAALIAGAVGAEWFVIGHADGGVSVLGDAPPEVRDGAAARTSRVIRMRAGTAHVVTLTPS
jgi:serine/threonine protein kinase